MNENNCNIRINQYFFTLTSRGRCGMTPQYSDKWIFIYICSMYLLAWWPPCLPDTGWFFKVPDSLCLKSYHLSYDCKPVHCPLRAINKGFLQINPTSSPCSIFAFAPPFPGKGQRQRSKLRISTRLPWRQRSHYSNSLFLKFGSGTAAPEA